MKPLMTRFCVIYSLEVGVISLCICSILVSGGLICNHQFKLPGQIRDWRNGSIYYDDQLNMLDLNVKIAIWVLVGDILCTLLMVLPVSLTSIEAPWKERNCLRKILIPCIIGKILCILHGITAFVWITWKFNYKCPEIVGILLALALYVLLGWYLVVVVISYYLHLGMRMTFHKLRHSQSDSTQRSQESQLHNQKGGMIEGEMLPSISEHEKAGKRRPGKVVDQRPRDADNETSKNIELKGYEEHKASQRKLYDHNDKKPEKRSHSSQEALDRKSHGSREKLSNVEDEREQQYKKLLRRSEGGLDDVDDNDVGGDDDGRLRRGERMGNERQKKRDNIRQVGPDQIEYHVSEREETDGGGKRRYYYKRDRKDPYERSTEDLANAPEMQKSQKTSTNRVRRESDDSVGSMGRLRSPPKYAPPRHQYDDSHDNHEDQRNHPYRPNKPQLDDRYDRPQRRHEHQEPVQVMPPYRPYQRDSDGSLDRVRSPPEYRPSPRMSDSSHNSYDRDRPTERDAYRQQYNSQPRRYYDKEQARQNEYGDEYDQELRKPLNARPDVNQRAYERDDGVDDYNDDDDDYIRDEYHQAPPYEDTRYQDGYISSEV